MHCFASENQIYTGTVIFGVESLKSLKDQENLLLKNLQLKTRVENVRFLSWRAFFVGKYGNFMRVFEFDAPTLLSFSGCTHEHAKCPPVLSGM